MLNHYLGAHDGCKKVSDKNFLLRYIPQPCHDENRTTFAVSTRASFEPISKQMRGTLPWMSEHYPTHILF